MLCLDCGHTAAWHNPDGCTGITIRTVGDGFQAITPCPCVHFTDNREARPVDPSPIDGPH